MKIKSTRLQIQEGIDELDRLIKWQQNLSVVKARRKLYKKSNWLFSFWIWDNSVTLDFAYETELSIRKQLEDYREVLRKELNEL